MDEVVSRAEHEEFVKHMAVEHYRLNDENARQNKRLGQLEQQLLSLNALTTAVEKIALSVEVMGKELTRLGKRLEGLENRDGEAWRQVKYYIITAVIGLVLGFLVNGSR